MSGFSATSSERTSSFRQRAWAVVAAVMLLAGLLTFSTWQARPVLGAGASEFDHLQIAIPAGTKAAGSSFVATVTALDRRDRVVRDFVGPVIVSGLQASPGSQLPVYGAQTWVDGVGTFSVTPVQSVGQAQLVVTSGAISAAISFDVYPAAMNALAFSDAPNSFNGQPVDAEFDTPIASSLGGTYVPVKVIALDAFGNRVGGVSITMGSSPDSATDTTDDLDGTKTASTNSSAALGTSPYGEAAFSSLSITKYGHYQLIATAGTASATSSPFEIVADLSKCTGSTCKSTGRSVGANLQITYSSLTGETTFSNVILTTSFIGSASDVQCASPSSAFGQLSEVRVQGAGVTAAQPDFELAMIVPKDTLQALALTSRAADSFNMCLGATRLDGNTGGWTGRETIGGPLVTIGDPDHDGIYWGFVADCGTIGLDPDSPCISLKTKNAGQMQTELGMTKNEFKALGFVSSDLGVVLQKPYPWDGKSGLY